jgi:uncharacterized protein with GYD domain
MPKYLWQSSYTAEGARGLLKEGASSRIAELRALAERGGGKIETIYWAFGESDLYIIGEAPDNAAAAAVSLAATASGASRVKTVVGGRPDVAPAPFTYRMEWWR